MKYKLTIMLVICFSSCNMDSVAQNIVVYIDKANTQCNMDGLGIKQSEQTLIDAGVDVIKTMCGYKTGLAYPAVCGGNTSDIIAHKIASTDLNNAKQYGYQAISTLVDTDNMLGYEIGPCADL